MHFPIAIYLASCLVEGACGMPDMGKVGSIRGSAKISSSIGVPIGPLKEYIPGIVCGVDPKPDTKSPIPIEPEVFDTA